MFLFYVHIYTKLQNVIQLSVTLTKLCPIKCDHLVFTFNLKTQKKRIIMLNIE